MANSGTTIEAPNTCEPMACSALTRRPKTLPRSSSANSPVTTWSRPCESPNSASERVDTHFTGRPPTLRDAQTTSASSG